MNNQRAFDHLNLVTYDAVIPLSITKSEVYKILDEKGVIFKQHENNIVIKSEVFVKSGLFAISFSFDGEKLVSLVLSPIIGDENTLLLHFDEIQKKLETMFGKCIHPFQEIMNFLDKRNKRYKWKTQSKVVEHYLRDHFGLEEIIAVRLDSK